MIIDCIDNILAYTSKIKYLQNGLEALKKLEQLEVGRYDFEGGYFMVQQGATKPMEEGAFEAHRKFIDLQMVLDGKEEVAWSNRLKLEEVTAYNEERDIAFYSGEAENHMVVQAGMCYLAYPEDAHKAVRHTKEPYVYTKVVMKLAV